MAVHGYCKAPDCERYVALVPKGYKNETSRERWWFPVDHDKPDGSPCVVGPKKGI